MTRNLSYYFFLMLFNVCKLKSKTEHNFTIIISQGKIFFTLTTHSIQKKDEHFPDS